MKTFRTTHQHPVCTHCGERHAPKHQRHPETPTASTKPEPVRKTHEEWCTHYGVPDWKKSQPDPAPSLIERARQAVSRTLTGRTADAHAGSAPRRESDTQVPPPPSLTDAIRAARRGQR